MSACVVNHQGVETLGATLQALTDDPGPCREILVVDNGSTDGSGDLVRRSFPAARLLELGSNRGAGAARNAGYVEAVHDVVLFLDNDVVPDAGCAERLLRALNSDPDAAFAMPRVVHAHDPGTVQFEGARSHFTGLMCLENEGRRDRGRDRRVRRVGSLVTACFMMDRRRWGRAPPFDESFFYIFEDHDLGLRARVAGHAILVVPEARCVHGEGTRGLSLRRTGRYTDTRIYHLIRNRWLILLKVYRWRTLVALAPGLLAFETFQLAGALKKGWGAHWWAAARWILTHLREILRKRRTVQSLRRESDGAILAGGPIPFTSLLHRGAVERAGRRVLEAVAAVCWAVGRPFL